MIARTAVGSPGDCASFSIRPLVFLSFFVFPLSLTYFIPVYVAYTVSFSHFYKFLTCSVAYCNISLLYYLLLTASYILTITALIKNNHFIHIYTFYPKLLVNSITKMQLYLVISIWRELLVNYYIIIVECYLAELTKFLWLTANWDWLAVKMQAQVTAEGKGGSKVYACIYLSIYTVACTCLLSGAHRPGAQTFHSRIYPSGFLRSLFSPSIIPLEILNVFQPKPPSSFPFYHSFPSQVKSATKIITRLCIYLWLKPL